MADMISRHSSLKKKKRVDMRYALFYSDKTLNMTSTLRNIEKTMDMAPAICYSDKTVNLDCP